MCLLTQHYCASCCICVHTSWMQWLEARWFCVKKTQINVVVYWFTLRFNFLQKTTVYYKTYWINSWRSRSHANVTSKFLRTHHLWNSTTKLALLLFRRCSEGLKKSFRIQWIITLMNKSFRMILLHLLLWIFQSIISRGKMLC